MKNKSVVTLYYTLNLFGTVVRKHILQYKNQDRKRVYQMDDMILKQTRFFECRYGKIIFHVMYICTQNRCINHKLWNAV